MAELNGILLSVLMILGSLVLIVLIFVLVRVSKTLRKVQEDVSNMSANLQPLIERAADVSEKTAAMIEDLNTQKALLESSVARVRDMTEGLYGLYQSFYSELSPAVDSVTRFLANLRRGVDTFLTALHSKR